ncbi:MAG TPA: hypothetical protein VFU21_05875 [Kofleriaceae bacterium]|nr:hypothetical protein [Kofleriaceae bacterium]
MPQLPPLTKCLIKNLDAGDEVTAYFNPKEIGITKNVPWNKHKDSKADKPILEFTDADPAELNIELLFDTFETRDSVYDAHISKLEKLVKVDEAKKRPPMVLFLWGTHFPKFMGVVSALKVQYTMFLPDGTPVRATATVTIKEGRNLKTSDKKSKSEAYDPNRPDKAGPDHRAEMDKNSKEGG